MKRFISLIFFSLFTFCNVCVLWANDLVIQNGIVVACVENTKNALHPEQERSDFFNTDILGQPEKVAQLLLEKGFQRINIPSGEHTLEAFFLNRNAQITVISVAGFFPGKTTGMATLYELLPENCNILLVNLRGKGNSTGRLELCKLWRYGVDEYQDVCAAIKFCSEKSSQSSIIVHGICAGAFHAIRAVHHLSTENPALYKRVVGIIIDGGFASIEPMAQTALPETFMKICGKGTVGSYLNPIVGRALCAAYAPVRCCVIAPLMSQYHEALTITPQMMKEVSQSCKFLFLHGKKDRLAPLENLQPLIDAVPENMRTLVTFDTSSHAVLHLKFTDTYQNALHQFLQNVQQKPLNSSYRAAIQASVNTRRSYFQMLGFRSAS